MVLEEVSAEAEGCQEEVEEIEIRGVVAEEVLGEEEVAVVAGGQAEKNNLGS